MTGATLIGRLRCRKVVDVNRRVIELIEAHPQLFITISVDNGPEFHGYKEIEASGFTLRRVAWIHEVARFSRATLPPHRFVAVGRASEYALAADAPPRRLRRGLRGTGAAPSGVSGRGVRSGARSDNFGTSKPPAESPAKVFHLMGYLDGNQMETETGAKHRSEMPPAGISLLALRLTCLDCGS